MDRPAGWGLYVDSDPVGHVPYDHNADTSDREQARAKVAVLFWGARDRWEAAAPERAAAKAEQDRKARVSAAAQERRDRLHGAAADLYAAARLVLEHGDDRSLAALQTAVNLADGGPRA